MDPKGTQREQPRDEIIEWLDATLWAPRLPAEDPRHFPRLWHHLRLAQWKLFSRLANLVFDRKLDTAEDVVRADHFHTERIWYSASGWGYLPRALKGVKIEPTDVFLDYGSGKGRVVYQAARYPFARVIGVEISPELSEIARKNLEQQSPKLRCKNVRIVTADAAEYAVPDDVTFAYFFHPFIGETFRRVVGQIVASLDRKPRKFTVIYVMPALENVLLETGRFRKIRTTRILHRDVRERLSVYEGL
jgi:SAM-dependent methyltransferase